MTKRMRYLGAALLTVHLFSSQAYGDVQNSESSAQRPTLTKIALVPVLDPPRLTIQNHGGALSLLMFPGYVIQKNVEDNRSNTLTSTLRNRSLKLGDEMTRALKEQLESKGYEVSVITQVERPYDDPGGVNYESIKTDARAILAARYDGAGLFSGFTSTRYLPRLNLKIEMVGATDLSDLYSQSMYYGADARKLSEDQIPSDPKYAYDNFDQALERQEELVEGFRSGINAIASQAAQQIRRVVP